MKLGDIKFSTFQFVTIRLIKDRFWDFNVSKNNINPFSDIENQILKHYCGTTTIENIMCREYDL